MCRILLVITRSFFFFNHQVFCKYRAGAGFRLGQVATLSVYPSASQSVSWHFLNTSLLKTYMEWWKMGSHLPEAPWKAKGRGPQTPSRFLKRGHQSWILKAYKLFSKEGVNKVSVSRQNSKDKSTAENVTLWVGAGRAQSRRGAMWTAYQTDVSGGKDKNMRPKLRRQESRAALSHLSAHFSPVKVGYF